ncbi:taste receptor type 1 member 3-like [Ochotona curzoniae]|uniref:taste receptor type 1 member 3 n=1 Tax=Ochotona curzoniae TaxID=130825 RepID=UPI001B3488CF|nr:taste receptor type 1 member 3 [Ochotona curzoniae]XP_040852973.1 taste receptor type 1 member 3-like [Ochotona curzoniae]
MPGRALLGLGLVVLLGPRTGAPLCLSRQLKMHGDYILGGLFPLGLPEEASLGSRTRPYSTTCSRFSPLGLALALALQMAVEEVNNRSDLLPGPRLGYDLFDTCSDPMATMKPSLMFLAEAGSQDIAAYCDYSQYQPRVLAVIGPHSSELALITGKFFSFFLMPQVSFGASMEQLSNRDTFQSFFRTVPSDRVQLAATVELLLELGWNWVAAVGSDDEYGRQGLNIFSNLASSKNVCIAHEGLAPLSSADSLRQEQLKDLLRQVNRSSVQVVVVFASAQAAQALFRHCIYSKLLPKVWVASEAWLTSDLVMTLPGMAQMGTVLGFLQRGAPLHQFPGYVQTRLALAANPTFCTSLDTEQPGLEEHAVGPRCPHCDRLSPQNLSAWLLQNLAAGQLHHQIFATYAAVHSVAQALHHTLRCNASGCPARERVRPWQLLQHMSNLSFRAAELGLHFDASGSVSMQYDLKLWLWRGPRPEFHTVGTFDGRLSLNRAQMSWHTPDNRVPESQCSRQCREGQVRRVKGFHSCCYDCADCKAGTYRHNPDDPTCTPCAHDHWSPDRSTRCYPRRPRFLAWGEPALLLLLLLMGLALGLALGALRLFLYHRRSPLVQASGGQLACFGLACLALLCLTVLLFPGWPQPASCLAQQPLAHLLLAGCLSSLLLQAADTFVESELPPAWATQLRAFLRGPRAWLAVLLAVLVEAAMCTWYLVAFPPEVVMDWQVLPTEVLVHCRLRSWAGLALLHAPNAALAFLCFLGTFLVQSQPGRYNRARGLTFAMLAYFITWVSYVPLLANVQVAYQPAVQMGAILVCALGILAAFHLPKCYLLLWQPDLNTPEFFLGEATGAAQGGPGTNG